MESSWLLLLVVLYSLAGMVYLLLEIRYIKSVRDIQVISIARLMYCFVYGILPAILYYREYSGTSRLMYIERSSQGIAYFFFMFFLSVVGYVVFNFAYNSKSAVGRTSKSEKHSISEQSRLGQNQEENIYCWVSIILLIVGWVSLYLWTKAYGSIWTFIENASLIRSGYSKVTNSLAFVKSFVQVLPFPFYGFLYLTLRQKNFLTKIGLFVLTLIGLAGCVVYTLASDSRITVGTTLLGAVLILIEYNIHIKRKSMRSQIVILAIAAVVGYLSIILSESVMNAFRESAEYTGTETDFFATIQTEFEYIIATQQNALRSWFNGDIQYKLFDDIYNAIFSWVPSRFGPSNMPETLWQYNTNMIKGSGGIWPTDILSAGIHHIGILGTVVLPFVYGWILKKIDKAFYPARNRCASIFYVWISMLFINNISHFQWYSIVYKLFPVFLAWLVYWFVKTLYTKTVRIKI